MLSPDIENIGILDVNGGPLRPKPGMEGHFVTLQITDKFIKNLREVVQLPIDTDTIKDRFVQSLTVLYPRESYVMNRGAALPDNLVRWTFLTRETPLPNGNSFVEQSSDYDFGSYDEFFAGYTKSQLDLRIVRQFREKGGDATFVSGIPFEARRRFRYELNEAWEYLNPRVTAILNPDLKHVSGIHTKVAAIALLGHAPVVNPYLEPNESGQSGTPNIFFRDDDYPLLLWIAHIFNIKVYATVSEEEAKKQPHLTSYKRPNRKSSNGLIAFDPEGEIMLTDVDDSSFRNPARIVI